MKTDIWIKVKYISDDGRVFSSKKICEAHEKDIKQGLPPDYQALYDLIVNSSASLKNNYAYGRIKNIKTSKDLKNWVQWNESNIFWNLVEPTKANYEKIKKVHKFQSPPSFPFYNHTSNSLRYDYETVYNMYYATFFSPAWHKQKANVDAAKKKIEATEADLKRRNVVPKYTT